MAWGAPGLAAEETDPRIAEATVRETRDLLPRELFGHYDVTTLDLLTVESLRWRVAPTRDHGLVRATLRFSATRNATRSPSFSPAIFERGGPCRDWLYLHCGVPAGHVFEGTLEVVLAVDRTGTWRAVSPHWRSRPQYPLDGYLLLDGRAKEGYVLPPPPSR